MSVLRPALFLGALLALQASGALADDPEKGQELAQQWCTRCHDIEADGAFKEYPPSFASIAVFRSSDQIYGRIMFPPLHANMPEVGYILTPGNVDDLVSYILSLETR